MKNQKPTSWLRTTAKVACVLLATASLGGCIIAPYPGYYHSRGWYRY